MDLRSKLIDSQDKGECVVEPRQDSFGAVTTASGLQAFSTTYTYSFWSYTPVTAVETTTFRSSQVTTSTVITVFAKDQFHALQSLLTAGQSVQDSASSSAAQATRLPASVSASSTTQPSTTSTASSSSSAPTSQATQGGSGCTSARPVRHGIALAGALALANL